VGDNRIITKQSLRLWEEFSNIPIDENECLEEEFQHFPVGTPREYVWHWFEDYFDLRVYDLMYRR